MNFIWDTTDHYSNYPEEIKKSIKKLHKIFKSIYLLDRWHF